MPDVSLPTFTAFCNGVVSVGVAADTGAANAAVTASARTAQRDRGANCMCFRWTTAASRVPATTAD